MPLSPADITQITNLIATVLAANRVKISALPPVGPGFTTDGVFPFVDQGSTQKISLTKILAKGFTTVGVAQGLRAIDSSTITDGQAFYTTGVLVPNDGGEGFWLYDANSIAADNIGTVIPPDDGIGRFIRQFSGKINVCWFGAKTDGTATDDTTTAINAAIALSANGDGVTSAAGADVYAPRGIYSVTTLDYKANVALCGDGVGTTIIQHDSTTGWVIDYDNAAPAPHRPLSLERIICRDLSVVQGSGFSPATADGGIRAKGNESNGYITVELENVEIVGAFRGVHIEKTIGSMFSNVRAIQCREIGIYGLDTFAGLFSNCFTPQSGRAGGSSGFYFSGGNYTTLLSCSSDDNGATGIGFNFIFASNFNLIGCGNEGNYIGARMTTCTSFVIDNFFTKTIATSIAAVFVDGSSFIDMRGLSCNLTSGVAGGAHAVLFDGTTSPNCSLTLGDHQGSAWPGGTTDGVLGVNFKKTDSGFWGNEGDDVDIEAGAGPGSINLKPKFDGTGAGNVNILNGLLAVSGNAGIVPAPIPPALGVSLGRNVSGGADEGDVILSNGPLYFYYWNGATYTKIAEMGIDGAITTGTPTGGTARPLKVGSAFSVSPTSPDRTIQIELNGVTYFLHAKTTNN